MRCRIGLFIAVGLLCIAVAGCATFGRSRIPEILNARIEPNVLDLGGTGVITVEIADRWGIVQRVEGKVVEEISFEGAGGQNEPIMFRLRDDGEPPDAAAGDGVWSLRVDVPILAPPGDYTLEFTAYDLAGAVVLVPDRQGNDMPLKTSFGVTIQYPGG